MRETEAGDCRIVKFILLSYCKSSGNDRKHFNLTRFGKGFTFLVTSYNNNMDRGLILCDYKNTAILLPCYAWGNIKQSLIKSICLQISEIYQKTTQKIDNEKSCRG